MERKIKVLVVDDSAVARSIISDILEADPMIEVIGTADNGRSAIVKNEALNPDVITMDVEMPVMDGLESLSNILERRPTPVIMMSVLTQSGARATIRALELGAVDFIPKPSVNFSLNIQEIASSIIDKVKAAFNSSVTVYSGKELRKIDKSVHAPRETGERLKIIGFGSSTGGPPALIRIFNEFPPDMMSPVLVVQHMPKGYTKAFAERLNTDSHLTVKEAENGDIILPRCGYVAPGDMHMELQVERNERIIRIFGGEKVSGHRPSIDVTFRSIAETCGDDAVGVIMTGMGKDGAEGLKSIRQSGGYTIAQDRETSVVFGMNRAAIESGAVCDVLPLNEITGRIVEHVSMRA